MSSEHLQAASEFVVRPDGTVVGSDGAAGALAAALPYTGRLARRMGELAGVGDLRAMEALGRRRLGVTVTWTPAGEGTYRATAHPVEPRVVPHFTVVGAVDAAAAVDHCLTRLMSLDGVRWSTVVTAGSRVVAARGEDAELHHLPEVGNRMLAILRSLEDQHASGFVRLRFEEGAVVGASLGRHALVAGVGPTPDADLVAVIDEVRAILAPHDLGSVRAPGDPVGPEAAAVVADAPQPVVAPPPLAGARFAGAGERKPRARRRRGFGLR
ncbi:hypothetical protein F4692_002997 [Nocardioides cavernae]|uniref:Uncharacterized protein n=1 Tax=Nocardioides cavernae TaxID=1921566 RepID=A0A7Y9H4P3_9ACTN|nr:hypothetical protein [Nocardioides cavernae]NYE37864.1 hypothetical protein [Nocardioides cavernae]